jgi:anti-anti-sigma regulatory factor
MNIQALIARCTLIREVNINFQTRTIGLFEIVEPVLEPDEVFDSNLLKQTIDSMISEGKRNISVDLARLDYLYSDTINALIVMNKRMLDVFGRLSLLAPQPPVMDILKKSGVQNILKVFADEAEIIRLSEDLAGQVGGIPAAAAHKAPISEFDDLRAEIGSAFGDGLAVPPAPAPSAQQPPAPVRHAPGPVAQPHFAPPHPQPGLPPRAPMAPMPASHEAASPKPPVSPKVPPKPAPAAAGPEAKRPVRVPEKSVPKPPPPKAAPVAAKPAADFDDFEAILEKKSVEKAVVPERTARTTPAAAKKSPAVPVAIAVVLLIVLGAGGYFAVTRYFSSGKEPALAPTGTLPETAKAAVPPVAAQPPAEKAPEQAAVPAPAESVATAAPAEEQQPGEAASKKAAHAKARAKKREAARKKAEMAASQEAETVASAKPAKSAAGTAKASASTTFIASQPPNADVYLDGQLIGKSYTELTVTPGTHTIRLVKDGKEVTQQITFHEGKNPTTFISIK